MWNLFLFIFHLSYCTQKYLSSVYFYSIWFCSCDSRRSVSQHASLWPMNRTSFPESPGEEQEEEEGLFSGSGSYGGFSLEVVPRCFLLFIIKDLNLLITRISAALLRERVPVAGLSCSLLVVLTKKPIEQRCGRRFLSERVPLPEERRWMLLLFLFPDPLNLSWYVKPKHSAISRIVTVTVGLAAAPQGKRGSKYKIAAETAAHYGACAAPGVIGRRV